MPHCRLLSPLIFVLFVCSCRNQEHTATSASDTINKDSLIGHVKMLASDDFQGRRPFTKGESKTIAYLQAECKEIGLEPGNGDSYLQDVPMVEVTPKGTPSLSIQSKNGELQLKNFDDFVMFTEGTDTAISLDNIPMVFAGFGVVAPEYNWNDYANIDVKGKIVLVMVNDPGFSIGDTTMFKGRRMTYYGRWTYKFEEAARQGAKGCIIIHNTPSAGYPFTVIQNSNSGTRLYLDPGKHPSYRCPVEGWITQTAANRILAAIGKDTSLYTVANKRGFRSFDMHAPAAVRLNTHVVRNMSHNVIAKISGTEKPDEVMIYTAHWDHFGIGKPDEHGDSIYNGALDNASGTAAVLELGRAFHELPQKPKRTVAFLFVTAEEQGLLGSEYYTEHPIYPLAKTIANINVDGINIVGRTKDVEITGAGQSELEVYLAEEVKRQNRYIAPETTPEAGHYFRSDHFNFAKAGVPALTGGSGIDDIGKGKNYGQQRRVEYTEKYYHRPSDEYDSSRWNVDGTVEDMDLYFQIGKRLVYGSEWPKWKQGSEFRAIRDSTKLQ